DGDGVSDADEDLIGTDPYDSSEDLDDVTNSYILALACFGPAPIFSFASLFDEKEVNNLIYSLNESSDAEIDAFVNGDINKILSQAGISADEVVYVNTTLSESIQSSSQIYYQKYDHYSILFVEDSKTGVVSVFGLMASCEGQVLGLLWGGGNGVKDDFEMVVGIIKGLWYYANNLGEIGKIVDTVKDAIGHLGEIWGIAGDIFHDWSMEIFEQGRNVNPYDPDTHRNDYRDFQIGFYQGFMLGYVVEQVFLLGKVGKAVESFKIGARLAETGGKALEILSRLTIKFGGSIADLVRKTKLWVIVQTWGDIIPENGIARLAVYLDDSKLIDDFVKGASNLKTMAIRIEEFAVSFGDEAAELLVKTKNGAEAIKAGWAMEELNGLYRIIDSYGDSFASRLKTYFSEDIYRTLCKGVGLDIIDVRKVNPEELGIYIKYWTGNPIDPTAGSHQLVKMYKAPGTKTAIGGSGKFVNDVAVLKKGTTEWGWEHIVYRNHNNEIKNAFDLIDNDKAVKAFIQEGLEKGVRNGNEIIWDVPGKTNDLVIVVDDIVGANPGSITTVYPN
ncbi:MAG: thrombospondin type 3 repeat-containing protein, partial [Nanoarchaeota archaeon]|nr:thrombospondin type 3 repeat-containing protein [Nanoarchaeota archaeon]